VENELAEAKELGLRGVPSFIVNGKRLVGPPSFEQLAAIIDEILAAQE
jgi:protein-disulfide isomerase